MSTKIWNDKGVLHVIVSYGHAEYAYARSAFGSWRMKGNDGHWFPCEPNRDVLKHVADYENCLRSYTFEEGPPYPTGRRGVPIAEYVKRLQRREILTGTKGIFAAVRLSYDPAAENRARFRREYGY